MGTFTKKLLLGLAIWIVIATYFAISKVQSGNYHPMKHSYPTIVKDTN
jgi:hypothetical protein